MNGERMLLSHLSRNQTLDDALYIADRYREQVRDAPSISDRERRTWLSLFLYGKCQSATSKQRRIFDDLERWSPLDVAVRIGDNIGELTTTRLAPLHELFETDTVDQSMTTYVTYDHELSLGDEPDDFSATYTEVTAELRTYAVGYDVLGPQTIDECVAEYTNEIAGDIFDVLPDPATVDDDIETALYDAVDAVRTSMYQPDTIVVADDVADTIGHDACDGIDITTDEYVLPDGSIIAADTDSFGRRVYRDDGVDVESDIETVTCSQHQTYVCLEPDAVHYCRYDN